MTENSKTKSTANTGQANLEDLSKEELIQIFHSQLQLKDQLKIDLKKAQENTMSLVNYFTSLNYLVYPCEIRRRIYCHQTDEKDDRFTKGKGVASQESVD